MRNIWLYIAIMMMVSACGGRVDFMQRQMVNMQVAMADYETADNRPKEVIEPQNPDTDETTDKDKNGEKEEIINPPNSGDLEGSIIYPDGDKDSGGKPTTGGGSIIDNILPSLPDESGGEGEGGEGEGGEVTTPTDPEIDGDGDPDDGGETTEENYRIPMVQRYDIQLKDGRNINVTLAETVLDNDVLQIRQQGDLMFKGLISNDAHMAQAGILKDLKNDTIYPVVLMETGSIASSIPQGGTWGGGWDENFYGEFQGEKHAYDIFGVAGAKVNLTQDRIEGTIDWLTYRPADTTLPVNYLDGSITFDGVINNQEWVGSAQSHGLKNPENGEDFSETTGFSEGVFASPTGGEASQAMGHVTLVDDDNQGLVGTFNMGHKP